VVKNVTGYDLCKLMAGSWGTLAAMTDVTIKVLPKAEAEETVLILGLDPARAVAAMALAMRCGCDPSAAAHLPAQPAARIAAVADAGGAVTAFRLEGVAPSVEHRKRGLEQVLRPYGTLAVLAAAESRALWLAIRDAKPFAAQPGGAERTLWRLSTTPGKGAEVGARLAGEAARLAAGSDAEIIYDWAGGLLWVSLAPTDDAGARLVRGAIGDGGGHATLIRAPAAVRAAVTVFSPQDSGVAALTKRVKESFDPAGVLNRGRMYAGV
jgi:glycolate oxidase FAD binding subunit